MYDCDDYQPLQYANCWQQRICIRVLNEIAKKIKFAATDDTMTIIENSEIMGYKGKNLVSALSDKLISILFMSVGTEMEFISIFTTS